VNRHANHSSYFAWSYEALFTIFQRNLFNDSALNRAAGNQFNACNATIVRETFWNEEIDAHVNAEIINDRAIFLIQMIERRNADVKSICVVETSSDSHLSKL
jgi:hypothetical protein